MTGYSGTPLNQKLGIKSGYSVYIFQAPEFYINWMCALPDALTIKAKLSGEFDFIHAFVRDRKTLEQIFVRSKRCLKKDGILWISWPKKSSKVPTDLDENNIRAFGLGKGLVDVKVCAIDEVWSGLKFVIRVKDR